MIKEKHGPEYEKELKACRYKSEILNLEPKNLSTDFVGLWKTESLNQLNARIKRHEEETIPRLKDCILDVEKEFKTYCQNRINQGKRKPDRMPPEIKERWDIACARLQIAEEELQAIKEFAASHKELKEKARDVLKDGPQGQGKLINGYLVELDGQKVKPGPDGILRICDERSPYNGMLTADYFDFVVRPYRKQCFEYIKRSEKEGRKRRKLTEIAKLTGEDLSDLPPVFSKKRPGLPPWPEEVPKPHKNPEHTMTGVRQG